MGKKQKQAVAVPGSPQVSPEEQQAFQDAATAVQNEGAAGNVSVPGTEISAAEVASSTYTLRFAASGSAVTS